MKALVLRDLDLLGSESALVKSILGAPNDPSEYLSTYHSPVVAEVGTVTISGAGRTRIQKVSRSLKVAK